MAESQIPEPSPPSEFWAWVITFVVWVGTMILVGLLLRLAFPH